ncbi:TAXI family TRAP transporter solute-binding subunit [Formosa sp. PL04]|uniref:TAXI family TRAP transporter solute-binding subunit n=1 Tax=Formosa sp. PL04 TaxID=3081755 RepID=UPI002981BFFA|nr:TAXI family TRAP transporter solute-binding subunit [Formosa sp. PL04]MDW5290699.1 TAXI family TRAP transporter solute-binding subunit [Formosa sp. PL04]
MIEIRKKNKRNILPLLLTLFIAVFINGCDFFKPQTTFRLAIPKGDFSYSTSAKHLKYFLEKGGYKINIIETENAIAANKLVAKGDADLTFIMNNSDFIPQVLDSNAGKLRTITPIFERLFFLFSKKEYNDSLNTRQLLEGRRIGIEVLNGETHANLNRLINISKIEHVDIVSQDDDPDFIHFWGTYYGPRADKLLANNWHEVSLKQDMIDFICLNDPALTPFTLPALPGVKGSEDINTFAVQTYLVGNSNLGEKTIYNLSSYILEHRLDLMGYDVMYSSANESIDVPALLYPIHTGTDAYFRRDEPTFFERYADVLALAFSIGAIVFGLIQTIRNRLQTIRKERIDLYFIEYIRIRSEKNTDDITKKNLDDLHQRALIQMTKEKLDKDDFNIFSRLIQQELNNFRQS